MKRRLAGSVVLAGAVLLVVETSAAAKPGHGPGFSELRSVVLRGPSIDGSIRLDGDDRAAKLLFRHSGTSWALMRGTELSTAAAPAEGDRSSRYEIRYELTIRAARFFDAERRVLRQYLYPYAKGRPWAFTPEGQGLSAHAGWWPVSTELVRHYDALGLPGLESVQGEQAHTGPRESSNPGSIAWSSLALLGALAASGAAWAYLRRPSRTRLLRV
jgi:hypothetical protein